MLGWITSWANRVVGANNLAILAGLGGLTGVAALIVGFATAYPIIAASLGTFAVGLLFLAAITYVASPAGGSYFPRYRKWHALPIWRVSWRLGGVNLFEVQGGREIIGEFRCSFRANRREIEPKRFVLQFSGKPESVEVRIQAGTKYVSCDQIEHIPPGTWHECVARILSNPNKPDDGVTNHPTTGEFFGRFGEFDLVFEYDGKVFRRRYSRYELGMMVEGQRNVRNPAPRPTPRLRDQAEQKHAFIERKDDVSVEASDSQFISLSEAARETFDRIKNTVGIQVVMRMSTFDQDTLLAHIARKLIDESVPIFGRLPQANKVDQIPADHALEYDFSDDATEMFDQLKPKNRYVELTIKRADMERRIGEIIAKDGAR